MHSSQIILCMKAEPPVVLPDLDWQKAAQSEHGQSFIPSILGMKGGRFIGIRPNFLLEETAQMVKKVAQIITTTFTPKTAASGKIGSTTLIIYRTPSTTDSSIITSGKAVSAHEKHKHLHTHKQTPSNSEELSDEKSL